MMKNKGNTALPDNRLAKLFNFTSEDLAANRLGFITSDQQFNAPMWQRKLFGAIGQHIKFGRTRQRVEVGKRCGQVTVTEETREIRKSVQRTVITDIVRAYSLYIKEKHFSLSESQFRALRDNAFYIVYYDTDNDRIVAIEQVENDC